MWIDHILSTSYDADDISSCRIIPLECDNVSDHLLIRLEMSFDISQTRIPLSRNPRDQMPIANWSRTFNNAAYQRHLDEYTGVHYPSHQ